MKHFNTGDCLIEVTAWTSLTVVDFIIKICEISIYLCSSCELDSYPPTVL